MINAAAEAETPPVTEPEGLVPTRPAGADSMLERWIESGDDRALKRIDVLVKTLEHLRTASIRATFPSDWIIHTSVDGDGNVLRQVGYLQDCGADRAGKIWGIAIERPSETREDFQKDGTFAYRLVADAYSKVTGERVENVLGSRWSGDKFFTKALAEGETPDPSDVAKAAYANLHGRAVRALAGLGGVPVEALKNAGLDMSRVVFVGYGKGAKGGESKGAGVGTAEFTVPWGNCKGKKLGELEDKDLNYYLRKAEEAVADPAKEKYREREQRALDAYRAEHERRKNAAEQSSETGAKPAAAGGDKPTAIGGKVRALHDRLTAALGKGKQRAMGNLLRSLTHEFDFEREMLSDCTEEELDKLAKVTDAELKTAAAEAVKNLGDGAELPLGGGKGAQK